MDVAIDPKDVQTGIDDNREALDVTEQVCACLKRLNLTYMHTGADSVPAHVSPLTVPDPVVCIPPTGKIRDDEIGCMRAETME